MQDQPNEAANSPTAAQDIKDQKVVLVYVLARHPMHLTIPELVVGITARSESFAEGDAVERAIRDLVGVGLLRCPGGMVMPTLPALHFSRLAGS